MASNTPFALPRTHFCYCPKVHINESIVVQRCCHGSQNCKIDPDNRRHEMPKEHHLVHVRFAPIYEQTYRYIPSSKDKKRTLGQWLGIIQNTGVECLDTITHQKEHTQMVSRLA